MAYKNKTVPTRVSPSRFLDSVENAQRLYINKLDDIDRGVLEKLIAKSLASTRRRIAAK